MDLLLFGVDQSCLGQDWSSHSCKQSTNSRSHLFVGKDGALFYLLSLSLVVHSDTFQYSQTQIHNQYFIYLRVVPPTVQWMNYVRQRKGFQVLAIGLCHLLLVAFFRMLNSCIDNHRFEAKSGNRIFFQKNLPYSYCSYLLDSIRKLVIL